LIAITIAVAVGLCGCADDALTVVPAGAATTAYPGAPAPLPSGLVDDYESLKETAYLLKNPANARRLLGSIDRLEAGHGTPHDLDE